MVYFLQKVSHLKDACPANVKSFMFHLFHKIPPETYVRSLMKLYYGNGENQGVSSGSRAGSSGASSPNGNFSLPEVWRYDRIAWKVNMKRLLGFRCVAAHAGPREDGPLEKDICLPPVEAEAEFWIPETSRG